MQNGAIRAWIRAVAEMTVERPFAPLCQSLFVRQFVLWGPTLVISGLR
jgi:hypothetical protein